jgi:ketosteroid isomerase-like protein
VAKPPLTEAPERRLDTFLHLEFAMTASRVRSSLPLVALLALVATSLAAAQGIDAPRVPVRTAIKEINTLRAEYAAFYNRKDAAALASMYMPDAVVIRGDGSTLLGREAIGKTFSEEAASWQQITLSSDTMRVFGNTAWDVGSMRTQGSGSDATVSHYLVVLRRGVQEWKISSLAVVPETHVTATK